MQDAWHVVKWVWVAALSTYLVVQVLALRRLKGGQKRQSNAVFTAMLILMFVSDAIRDVFFFEGRIAGLVGMSVVGIAAIVATLFLARMFGENSAVAAGRHDDEHKLQSLKLS